MSAALIVNVLTRIWAPMSGARDRPAICVNRETTEAAGIHLEDREILRNELQLLRRSTGTARSRDEDQARQGAALPVAWCGLWHWQG